MECERTRKNQSGIVSICYLHIC